MVEQDTLRHLIESGELVHWKQYVYVIGGLVAAIVGLCTYIATIQKEIRRLNKEHNVIQQENIKVLVEEATKTRSVIDTSNKLYDRIFDHITKAPR